MGETSDEPLSEWTGRTIRDRYQLVKPLASGGMGVVFEGVDKSSGERVAVKLMQSELTDSPEAYQRFRREVTLARTLSSPHLVEVFDGGVLDEGLPFMVMELLEGQDLDAYLEERGPVPTSEALRLLVDILEGLGAAHAEGVVHRDLKPANIFLPTRGGLKLLDFGIAKAFDDAKLPGAETGKLTSTRSVLGSPAYMSPEQLTTPKDVDGRTDLWSAGVILFELLTGRLLFAAETVGATFANVLNMPIPRLGNARASNVLQAVEGIVARCLERDPDDRYQTVAELQSELERLVARPIRASLPPTGAAAPKTTTSPSVSYDEDTVLAPTVAQPSHPPEQTFGPLSAATMPVDKPSKLPLAVGGTLLLLGVTGYFLATSPRPGGANGMAPTPKPSAASAAPFLTGPTNSSLSFVETPSPPPSASTAETSTTAAPSPSALPAPPPRPRLPPRPLTTPKPDEDALDREVRQ